jgi:serine/threonine-protein kinase
MPVAEAVLRLGLSSKEKVQEAIASRKALIDADQPVPSLLEYFVRLNVVPQKSLSKLSDYRLVKYYASRIPGYEIKSVIGHGSGGIVYMANQVMLDRMVAVKILRHDLAENPDFRQRFLSEARAAAKLAHPNIVSCFDAGDVGSSSYMVLEFVDGRTIADLVRERGPLDARLSLKIARDIALALQHAAKFGVVHRDIKPENVMLTRDKQAKVLDLGLARGEWKDGIAAGMAVGTPNYMSPEQVMGDATLDHRSDFYSLGVTMFYMAVGSTPFLGTPEQVMFKHVNSPPPIPSAMKPEVPMALSRLILRLLAKKREDRPGSAEELLALIDSTLVGLDSEAAGAAAMAAGPGSSPRLPSLRGRRPGGMRRARPQLPTGGGQMPMGGGPAAPPPPGGATEPRLPIQRKRPPIPPGV